MLTLFIVLQCLLLIFMVFHDWIPVPPFNDLKTLKAHDSDFYRLLGSVVNGVLVLIPLTLTVTYFTEPPAFWASFVVVVFYLLLTVGTILSWWVPYFGGSSQTHKEHLDKFKNTHHFLPPRGDHIVPNTLHVVLHVQVWACLILALYYFIKIG